jgi:UDP-glucose-4-epimerase GalE
MARYPIDGVLHFAGKALVAESHEDPAAYYETNVVGGINLLRAMKAKGVRILIFSSTCATYGIPETIPIREDHPQKPVNPYGETKLAFERALRWFHEAYGLSYLSMRYFNAAGADPDGEFGEDHSPESHLIPLTLDVAAKRRPIVRILGTDYPTPDGTCLRDYIHVTDLAEAHVVGLKRLLEERIASQALNLGTGSGFSVRQVIQTVERITGRVIHVEEAPRRTGDPPHLVADPQPAGKLLGWKPVLSDLDTIVGTAWQWHSKR